MKANEPLNVTPGLRRRLALVLSPDNGAVLSRGSDHRFTTPTIVQRSRG